MAWTAPKTFTSGSVLSQADLNTFLKANLEQTFPALATTDNQYLISNGANVPAVRSVSTSVRDVSSTRASAAWGNCADLANSPECASIVTGTRALAFISCASKSSVANGLSRMGVAMSGSTVASSTPNYAFVTSDQGTNNWMGGCLVVSLALTAGTTTFTAEYQTDSGTSTFHHRELTIMPF